MPHNRLYGLRTAQTEVPGISLTLNRLFSYLSSRSKYCKKAFFLTWPWRDGAGDAPQGLLPLRNTHSSITPSRGIRVCFAGDGKLLKVAVISGVRWLRFFVLAHCSPPGSQAACGRSVPPQLQLPTRTVHYALLPVCMACEL